MILPFFLQFLQAWPIDIGYFDSCRLLKAKLNLVISLFDIFEVVLLQWFHSILSSLFIQNILLADFHNTGLINDRMLFKLRVLNQSWWIWLICMHCRWVYLEGVNLIVYWFCIICGFWPFWIIFWVRPKPGPILLVHALLLVRGQVVVILFSVLLKLVIIWVHTLIILL